MFLLLYYIISVIGTFILLSYIIYKEYKEEKRWNMNISIYDIDIHIIGMILALSVIPGVFLFPYMIIRLIIEKIKGRI